jgi:hypothetical protein
VDAEEQDKDVAPGAIETDFGGGASGGMFL